MSEYFKGIPNIKYEGAGSDNPLAFRYYNPDEMIGNKTMREQLKFAMSYWHTLCAEGADMFGCGTFIKDFGKTNIIDIFKAKANAAFELIFVFMIEILRRRQILLKKQMRD